MWCAVQSGEGRSSHLHVGLYSFVVNTGRTITVSPGRLHPAQIRSTLILVVFLFFCSYEEIRRRCKATVKVCSCCC